MSRRVPSRSPIHVTATSALKSGTVAFSTDAATLNNNIQTALNNIFGAGNASVVNLGQGQFRVAFQNALSNANLLQLNITGTDETQRLTFTNSPATGTFTLNLTGAPGTPQTVNYTIAQNDIQELTFGGTIDVGSTWLAAYETK